MILLLKMPSRKKAKGKARKAKAKEGNLILHDDNVCRHGCEPISKGDFCYKFVKQFEVEMNAAYDFLPDAPDDFQIASIYNKTIERLDDEFNFIWHDEDIQMSLVQMYICLGTNLLLKSTSRSNNMASAVTIAVLMSQFNNDMDKLLKRASRRSLIRDLEDGIVYDAVKFFLKRTPCQCLKKMYYRLKPLSRTAICYNCSVEKDRKFLLYLCNGCHYRMYCCIHCQAADWSAHKEWCRRQTNNH